MKKAENTSKRWILKNLLLGLAFIAALLLVAVIFLRIFTQHDISVTVPDFVGRSVEQNEQVARKAGVTLTVSDSVYVSKLPRGAVYNQNPAAGEKVKRGRKVYLTINARQEKRVMMPDLVGLSLRQAKVELSSRGLMLGHLEYVKDIATNNVLGQSVYGRAAEPGERIKVGTRVDLRLGLNPVDGFTVVPNLTGVKYNDALNRIKDQSLNVGKVIFDSSIHDYADSLKAFVYRQTPPSSDYEVQMGTSVSVFLTLDEDKLPKIQEESSDAAYLYQ